jgi:hypothetical protein
VLDLHPTVTFPLSQYTMSSPDAAEPTAAPRAELAADPANAPLPEAPELRAQRLSWAKLLKRVFGLDVGYPTEAPPLTPARAPPQPDLWGQEHGR